jgi:hypothetical protein
MTEFIKTIGVLIVAFMTVYVIITLTQSKNNSGIIEGMENETAPKSGEAGSAASYADSIKAQNVKIQDELLVPKYRKDYENTIIHMDDLVGTMMIKQIQNMTVGGSDSKSLMLSLNNLNTLKMAKESLGVAMKYLDGM